MKTIIVYTSQTGFTEQYVKWLAEEISSESMETELLTFAEAKKQKESYFAAADTIVYAGWVMGGNVVNKDWFAQKIPTWKDKKLVLLCVGATPCEVPEVAAFLESVLTEEEKKYVKAFYCQGGLAYEKMKLPSKLMMKAFTSMMKKKKDATKQEQDMAEMLGQSYDISDRKYLDPLVGFIGDVSSVTRSVPVS